MNAPQAREFLTLLRANYIRLGEKVDLEMMPYDDMMAHAKAGAHVRPFRIQSWFCRQSSIQSAWSLWDYFSRVFCEHLPSCVTRDRHESCVTWVARSLAVNHRAFSDRPWFEGANALRNLLVHSAGRVLDPQAERQFERARMAFPDLEVYLDHYVYLTSDHVHSYFWEIDEFILETTRGSGISRVCGVRD